MSFITLGNKTINTRFIWGIEIDRYYIREQQGYSLKSNDGYYSFTILFEHMDQIVMRYPSEAEMFKAHGQLLDVLMSHRLA